MFGLPIWLVSIGFGLLVCLFFLFISLFTKSEDYLLPDYTEEDAPDNVRIIEKEVRVVDNQEVDRLNKELNIINENSKNKEKELNEQLLKYKSALETTEETLTKIEEEKNNLIEEKDTLSKDVSNLQSLVDDYSQDITNKKEVITQLEEQINLLEEKYKSKVKENKELVTHNTNLDKEFTLVKHSMADQEKETSLIIDKIKNEKSKLEEDLKKVEENRKQYQDLFKNSKTELEKVKEKLKEVEDTNKKAMEDRDYFSTLVDKKEEKISNLQNALESKISPVVYEGTDDYGHFYDIYNIKDIPQNLVNKIQDINDQLESGQVAFFTYNNFTKRESVQIDDISNVDKFMRKVNHKETVGKYYTFIIMNNKVYPHKIW
jgi:chromosome segregation ATPase